MDRIKGIILDDQEINHRIFGKFLDKYQDKIDFLHADDPFDAYYQIKSEGNLEFIILDLNLKISSGFDLFDKLIDEGLNKTIKIIPYTSDKEEVAPLIKKGAHSFILKPANKSSIEGVLDKILE